MTRWRFRAMPLRSRLALMTGLAVAIAVALVAMASWFAANREVMSEFYANLRDTHPTYGAVQAVCAGGSPGYEPNEYIIQVIRPDGSLMCANPDAPTIQPTSDDVAMASAQLTPAASSEHETKNSDGSPMYVVTRPNKGPEGGAVMLAAPLDQVQRPLDRLAVVLVIVAGIGVVAATTTGLAIARAGLRPVDRLTDAAEHIARTEDLAVRIPVDGQDEIARLSRSFNSMTAALASSRERQQQLIADAGHELRTPLTSLRTNIELLVRSEETGRPLPPEDRRALLASVKAQMGEMALLIGDLQELSRPDVLPGSGRLQDVGLHEIAAKALRRARLRGPDLTFRSELAPWYVRAEAASMERAVVNLLDNAVKFSRSGGSVEVRLDGGELTVRDHGPGIPAEDLPHVFERFWRSPSARSLPGSGLGLSIVARTIAQAGGAVTLHPAPGGGTIASVRVPGTATPPPCADDDTRDLGGSAN